MSTVSNVRRASANNAMLAANGSYELYDGKMISSLDEELHSPPGGPSCHPSGSPKLMRDNEKLLIALKKKQEETDKLRLLVEDLQRKNKLDDSLLSCEDVTSESSTEQERKDCQIRHLQRQVTVLQADLFKKDGLEHRMIELKKEKDLADDRVRTMAIQLDKTKREMQDVQERLLSQMNDLEVTIKHQRDEIQQLRREMKTKLPKDVYESVSPPSSVSSALTASGIVQATSSSSSTDSQSYSRELDFLHKMVDVLRATVMEQRRVFKKMGLTIRPMSNPMQNQLPDAMSASMPVENTHHLFRSAVGDVSNNVATSTSARASSESSMQPYNGVITMRPVREAEESCEIITTQSNNINNNVSLKVHSSANRGVSKERTTPPTVSPFPCVENHNGNTNHLTNCIASSASPAGVESNPPQQSRGALFPSTCSGSPAGSPRRSRPSSVSSELVTGMEKLNMSAVPDVRKATPPPVSASASSDHEDIYVNNANAFGMAHEQELTADKNAALRDSFVNFGNQYEAAGLRAPRSAAMRKMSRSEVIERRPPAIEVVTLPTKSRTEIISKNPNNNSSQHFPSSHQQPHVEQQLGSLQDKRLHQSPEPSDALRPQYPPAFQILPSPTATVTTTTASGAVQFKETGRGVLGGGIPGGARPPPPNNAWQNSYPAQAHPSPNLTTTTKMVLPPFEAEACVISPVPANYSNTLSNISDVPSTFTSPQPLQTPHHQQQQQERMTGRPQNNNNSNSRVCPVCNQDFSQISMEDFQTHVFDCFDNDNGPETLQAEMVSDYPPQMLGAQQGHTCPMCQQKFPMSTSQSEFEQHVHRHFGEEAFEVL